MLSLAVSQSKPTLKQWHRPKSELQESAEHAFQSCHIHIKCLPGNTQWMTDKLRFILRVHIDPNNVRTVYDSRNQSALIPTTEHCSFHYILSSYDTVWKEVSEYIKYNIRNFMFRRTFQTAVINVVDWSPLSHPTISENDLFQLYDAHHFFLNGQTGWLYFRNVRGDRNAWERSRDHKGLISSKMGGKWDQLGCTAKIGVSTRDTGRFLNVEENAGQCGFRRVPGSKQSIHCSEDTMMAEFAADVLNFTKVFTYDMVNRRAFLNGFLQSIYSSKLDLDQSLFFIILVL
jgi:hypothetical protein